MKSRLCRRVAASLAALLMLFGVGAAAQEVTITFGIPWGLDVFDSTFLHLAREFEARNPGIKVEVESGWSTEKQLVSATAGTTPDVMGLPSHLPEHLVAVLSPIDDWLERSDLGVDDYIAGTVLQVGGRTYALPMFIDPNFPLYYNKTLFAEAGLDPESPPTTIAEVDALFPRLTRRHPDGQLSQLAMAPWMLSDWQQTWGLTFGGKIWEGDENSGRYALNTQPWRDAFNWMKQYYDQYFADTGHWGDLIWWQRNHMANGWLVMTYHVSPALTGFRSDAPHYEFGIGAPLTTPGGAEAPIWFGGFRFGLGKYAEHPEEALKFLYFLTTDPEVSVLMAERGLFPARVGAPGFQRLLEREPEWQGFIELIPRSPGNLYEPPIRAWDEAWAKMRADIFGGGVPVESALANLEATLNAAAREAGIYR